MTFQTAGKSGGVTTFEDRNGAHASGNAAAKT